MPDQPDFASYHRSLGLESKVIQDRVRDLINHWPTDGGFKESALRSVLRRHLPSSMTIATGFIVTKNECSTQIDILILDADKPTLFKEGDLVIVTPDSVRGIIEVKTNLSGEKEISDALTKLTANALLASATGMRAAKGGNALFTGLFVYNAKNDQENNFLSSLKNVAQQGCPSVDCIAYGENQIFSYLESFEIDEKTKLKYCWVSAHVEELAAAYFIGTMLNKWFRLYAFSEVSAWLPSQDGNRICSYVERNENNGVHSLD